MLIQPPSYLEATEEERAAVVNGCGPGNWKLDLVPDELYGLDITEACNIHDWMYHEGTCEDDRHKADRVFLCNILHLIDDNSVGIAKWARREAAWMYFKAVSDFGRRAFWEGKPDPPHDLTGFETRC